MGRGKRYDAEPKLNYKKVAAVVIAIAVVIMIIITVKQLANNSGLGKNKEITTYFSSYSNGKWGIINNSGTVVIESAYDEMIVVPNKEKPVFLCIYDVNDVERNI